MENLSEIDLQIKKLLRVLPEEKLTSYEPIIHEINRLKKEKNAIILVHNYQVPEIFYGVADITGDSLGLAKEASKTDADIIVLCGVHFMAETAKLLNPKKKVLIPDLEAGCSLASAITAQDLRALKAKYPGVPVVTYVNTTAAVKAESDVCCTSANAVEIVKSLGVNRVIFLPDEFLGQWVQSQTDVEVILWKGHCEVHEQFDEKQLALLRHLNPGVHVIAHPECASPVLKASDFVGSTTAMIKHLEKGHFRKVAMITECSMSTNVAVEFPHLEFIGTCRLCPHMQRITLPKVLVSLKEEQYEVTVPDDVADRARLSVERMLEVGQRVH